LAHSVVTSKCKPYEQFITRSYSKKIQHTEQEKGKKKNLMFLVTADYVRPAYIGDCIYDTFILLFIYYTFRTKGPTGHLQCYRKTQKYNCTL